MSIEAVQHLYTFHQTSRWIGDVRFSSDAGLLAVSTENEISIYDLRNGDKTWSFPIDGFAHVVRFGVDDEILAAGGSNGKVYIADIVSRTVRFTLKGHTTYVRALAFSPDGATVFSGSQDATVRSWDIRDGSLKASVPIHLDSLGYLGSNLRAIAISPSSGSFASSWFDLENDLRISALSSGTITQRVSTLQTFETIGLSPDGTICVGGGFGGSVTHVKLAQTAEGTPEIVVNRHSAPSQMYYNSPCKIDQASVSSDGRWVISSSKGTIHFTVPMAKHTHFEFAAGGPHVVWAFDFHPASGKFAGAVSDGSVRIWRVDPTVRNYVSPPPLPPANYDYDSDEFDDPYPWKD